MNSILRLGGAMLCAVSVAACATVTRGTKQAYVIETDPPGAQVALSTGQSCVTPCALRLPRKRGFTVDITRQGYEPIQATVTSGVSTGGAAGMAGNVILGGLIGAVVDGASGAMRDLRPNPLQVAMVPAGGAPAAATAAEPTVLSWDGSAPPEAEAAPAEPAPGEAPAADAAEAAPTADAGGAPERR